MYDDAVVIAQTPDTGNTDNCGWYGCRVAGVPDCYSLNAECGRGFNVGPPSMEPAMIFTHGSNVASGVADAMGFFFRRPVGLAQGSGCINYGDSVVIAFTGNVGDTGNCGWYGCRVAFMNEQDQTMLFGHGGDAPIAFFIHPPVGVARSGCVQYGDGVVIAQTADLVNTQNCGWYGCRVARMGELDLGGFMRFDHGGEEPQVFYLRPTPPSGA